MSYLSVPGYILWIGEPQKKTETFSVRECVINTSGDPSRPQWVKFQFYNNNMALLDGFQVGQLVEIDFNIRSRAKLKEGMPNAFENYIIYHNHVGFRMREAQPRPAMLSRGCLHIWQTG